MKKITFSFMSLIGFLIVFVSCSKLTSNNVEESSFEPRSSLAKTYISLVQLQQNAAIAGIDAVSNYVELPNSNYRNISSESFNLDEIGSYLPSNLSTLT